MVGTHSGLVWSLDGLCPVKLIFKEEGMEKASLRQVYPHAIRGYVPMEVDSKEPALQSHEVDTDPRGKGSLKPFFPCNDPLLQSR